MEHQKISEEAAEKPQTSKKAAVKAACELPAPLRPSTARVAETCHSAEDAGDRREQQTASHPYMTAAAVIRI